MGDDFNAKKKKRKKDDERDRELGVKQRPHLQKKLEGTNEGGSFNKPTIEDTELLKTLLNSAQNLIEQVNNLYQQYFAGVEKKVPKVPGDRLKKIMDQISLATKPTPALRFKSQTIRNAYLTYKEKWERQLKKLENSHKKMKVR